MQIHSRLASYSSTPLGTNNTQSNFKHNVNTQLADTVAFTSKNDNKKSKNALTALFIAAALSLAGCGQQNTNINRPQNICTEEDNSNTAPNNKLQNDSDYKETHLTPEQRETRIKALEDYLNTFERENPDDKPEGWQEAYDEKLELEKSRTVESFEVQKHKEAKNSPEPEERQRIESKINENIERINEIDNEIEKLSSEIDEYAKESHQIKEEIEYISKEKLLKNKIREAIRDKESLTTERDELMQKNASDEDDELTVQIAQYNEKIDDLNKYIDNLEEEIKNAEEETEQEIAKTTELPSERMNDRGMQISVLINQKNTLIRKNKELLRSLD